MRVKLSVKHEKVSAMWLKDKKKWNNKGQHIMEYAIVAAIISAAVLSMSTYVFRSITATQQMIMKESANQ